MNRPNPPSRRPSWLRGPLRVAAPVALFMFLGGTTPGSVGSCADTDAFADFESFCNAFEQQTCNRLIRANMAGIVPLCSEGGPRCLDVDACQPAAIANDCAIQSANGGWATVPPPGICIPPATVDQVNACLTALTVTALTVPENQIAQCQPQFLCAN